MLLEDLLVSLGVSKLDMFESIGRSNPVDFFFKHGSRRYCVEIKVRDRKFLDSDCHFLEVAKCDRILKAMKANNCNEAIYVNFFGDDDVIIYKLTNGVKFEKDTIKMNLTTAINNGKVLKEVYKCTPRHGVRLKRTSKGWIINES